MRLASLAPIRDPNLDECDSAPPADLRGSELPVRLCWPLAQRSIFYRVSTSTRLVCTTKCRGLRGRPVRNLVQIALRRTEEIQTVRLIFN